MDAKELAYYYIAGVSNTHTADAFLDTAVFNKPLHHYDSNRLFMVAMHLQVLAYGEGPLSEEAADQLKAYLSKLEAHLYRTEAQGQGDSPTS